MDSIGGGYSVGGESPLSGSTVAMFRPVSSVSKSPVF